MTPDSSKNDTLYRKLVENMNEGVWMGDKDERTVYANPAFCRMLGYSLKEILGRQSYDFWDEASKKRVQNVNKNERKKGVTSSYEGTLITKNGTRIPVLLSGTPLPNGGTIGIMTDLREVKSKQETAMLLEHALEASTEGIVLIKENGSIASWNQGARYIFGFASAKMIGTSLNMIFPRWDPSQHLPKTSGEREFQMEAKHKAGATLTIAAAISILPSNNQKLKYLMILRDITAQRRFEEELALKYQKMSDAYNRFGIVRRQMDYMYELLEISTQKHDDKTIADYIVSSVVMLSHVDGCVLQEYTKDGYLKTLSSFGLGQWKDESQPFKESVAERSFKELHPVKILDIVHEQHEPQRNLLHELSFTSALVIALTFQGHMVGSLSLYVTAKKKLELFENTFIEKYAELIAVILAKRKN